MNKQLEPHQSIQLGLIALILTVVVAIFVAVVSVNSKLSTTDTRVEAFSGQVNNLGKMLKTNVLPKPATDSAVKKLNPDNIADCSVCDINKDGVSDRNDLSSVVSCYIKSVCPEADINADGVVDTADLTAAKTNKDPEMMKKVRQCMNERTNLQKGAVETCLPDVNADGTVNHEDVVACIRSCHLPNKNRQWKQGPTGIPPTVPPDVNPTVNPPVDEPTMTPVIVEPTLEPTLEPIIEPGI